MCLHAAIFADGNSFVRRSILKAFLECLQSDKYGIITLWILAVFRKKHKGCEAMSTWPP